MQNKEAFSERGEGRRGREGWREREREREGKVKGGQKTLREIGKGREVGKEKERDKCMTGSERVTHNIIMAL